MTRTILRAALAALAACSLMPDAVAAITVEERSFFISRTMPSHGSVNSTYYSCPDGWTRSCGGDTYHAGTLM